MLALILVGAIYSLLTDSIPASVITGAMILYRAQRPSLFMGRLREAWLQREAARVAAEDVRE